MNWTRALRQDELPEDARQVVKVGDLAILLIRFKDQIYALQSRCPHLGGRLQDGKITEEGSIICPLHHSEFDLRTGQVKAWAPWPPGVSIVLRAVRQQQPLTVYATKVEDGSIWIETEIETE